MRMHQYWFINCNKSATWLWNVGRESCVEGMQDLSVLSFQFFCKSKTVLKKWSLFLKDSSTRPEFVKLKRKEILKYKGSNVFQKMWKEAECIWLEPTWKSHTNNSVVGVDGPERGKVKIWNITLEIWATWVGRGSRPPSHPLRSQDFQPKPSENLDLAQGYNWEKEDLMNPNHSIDNFVLRESVHIRYFAYL